MRFTFVIGRYGQGTFGGAQKHAREIAERLVGRGHYVRVLTTCARHDGTFTNELPAGQETLNGVEVHRFPVKRERLRFMSQVLKKASVMAPFAQPLTWGWARAQGPYAPELLAQLADESSRSDMVVFFRLLSHLSFWGLHHISLRSALVPLVHEEPAIYTSVARGTLCLPRVILANTEEEYRRIRRIAGRGAAPGVIVALGQDEAPPPDLRYRPPTDAPYFLMIGPQAKHRPMLQVWRELMKRQDQFPLETNDRRRIPWNNVKLVTIGETSPRYHLVRNVIPLGNVSQRDRWELLRRCIALINPSVHESLSLALLEAWACRVSVIVNKRCDVTVGQCERSSGGFAINFSDPIRGAEQLARQIALADARKQMGEAGLAYVRSRYQWDRVLDAYEGAAQSISQKTDPMRVLRSWHPV